MEEATKNEKETLHSSHVNVLGGMISTDKITHVHTVHPTLFYQNRWNFVKISREIPNI
jgi:hypothetical protein